MIAAPFRSNRANRTVDAVHTKAKPRGSAAKETVSPSVSITDVEANVPSGKRRDSSSLRSTVGGSNGPGASLSKRADHAIVPVAINACVGGLPYQNLGDRFVTGLVTEQV